MLRGLQLALLALLLAALAAAQLPWPADGLWASDAPDGVVPPPPTNDSDVRCGAPGPGGPQALLSVGFDWSAAGLKVYADRPFGIERSVARHLQATTCTPSTANAVWSGSPPDLFAQRCVCSAAEEGPA
jgi:hypothetical protein